MCLHLSLALVFLLHDQPVGRLALPEAAAVVWEAASTVPDPSEFSDSSDTPTSTQGQLGMQSPRYQTCSGVISFS